MEPIGISIQRNAPGRPSVGKLKDVQPGNITLDLSWLQPDAYFLFISAPGYANAFAELVVKSQKIALPTNNVTLFRKRYAIIRYSIAPAGKQTLDGPDVERGRSVVFHGRCLVPFLEGEWSGAQWSTNVFLHCQMFADFHGIANVPTKTPFEQLVEAPPNDAYHYHYEEVQLTPGLILCFRTSKDERYGKLLVEDITETPPPEVQVIDSK